MPSTGIINGSIILISTSTDGGTTWVPLAHATDNSLEVTTDTRQANTKSSSGWNEFLPSFKSWTMSGESLFAFDAANGFSELLAIMDAQENINVKIGSSVTGDSYWSGSAVLTSISLNAPMEDNGSMSYSLQGSGALTEAVNA